MGKKIEIGLAIEDKAYADALAERLSVDFNVNIIGNTESEKWEILLTDDEGCTYDNAVVLTKEFKDEGVYMYSGINRITRYILDIYCRLYDDVSMRIEKLNSKIIGVSGECGGIGTSTGAIALGRMLARKGFKTIYMTLDSVPYKSDKSKQATAFLNKLMYIMSEKEPTIGDIYSCIYDDGYGLYHFNYLNPYNLLEMMDSKDLQIFLTNICEFFEYVIVDMGSRITIQTTKIYEIAKYIILFEKIKGNKSGRVLQHINNNSTCKVIEIFNFTDDEDEKKYGDLTMKTMDEPIGQMCDIFEERLEIYDR